MASQMARVLRAWTEDEGVRQAVAIWEAQLGTAVLPATMVALAQRTMDALAK